MQSTVLALSLFPLNTIAALAVRGCGPWRVRAREWLYRFKNRKQR